MKKKVWAVVKYKYTVEYTSEIAIEVSTNLSFRDVLNNSIDAADKYKLMAASNVDASTIEGITRPEYSIKGFFMEDPVTTQSPYLVLPEKLKELLDDKRNN